MNPTTPNAKSASLFSPPSGHLERDHQVRFVFPRLREELLPRRIHFVDVDLRWGVASDRHAVGVYREIIDEYLGQRKHARAGVSFSPS